MLKIRIFSDYTSSTQHLIDVTNWNNGSRVFKNIEFVDDDSFTHAVIYNKATPNLSNIPKENVIGFTKEPLTVDNLNSFIDYTKNHIGRYIVPDNTNYPKNIFHEYHSFMGPQTNNHEHHEKHHIMSIIASHKNQYPGHQLRHKLIQKLIHNPRDIHIYGQHLEHVYRHEKVKGTLQNKADGLSSYIFTISIENCQEKFYISEKYGDCIYYNSIPIYWGCPNIKNIYGKNACIDLPSDVNQAEQLINNIYDNPNKYMLDLTTPNNILKNNDSFIEYIHKYFNGEK